MADRSNQPAVLRRRIAQLEALLAAETERAEKSWVAYRDNLYKLVEAEQYIKRIQAAVEDKDYP